MRRWTSSRPSSTRSIWLTIGNAGIGHRVKAAGGPDLKAFLPKEGYVGYYDGDCLVRGAAHKEGHRLAPGQVPRRVAGHELHSHVPSAVLQEWL